jgi:hypothetical protein
LPPAQPSFVAFGLGAATGLCTALFREPIGLIVNPLFAGHAITQNDANIFAGSVSRSPLLDPVAALGAVGVIFLVTNMVAEVTGTERRCPGLHSSVPSYPLN